MGGADRVGNLVDVGVLEQVARRASFECGVHALLLDEGRENDDLDIVVSRANLARRLDAVHDRHLQVHENHVGPASVGVQFGEDLERLASVLSVADDFDVRFGFQEAE